MLKKILEKVRGIFREMEPTEDVKQALETFMKVPDVIIKHQRVINQSVENGRKATVEMRKREIVTVEDYKQMRGYQVDMVRSAYWQNEIQFKTADERERSDGLSGFDPIPLQLESFVVISPFEALSTIHVYKRKKPKGVSRDARFGRGDL